MEIKPYQNNAKKHPQKQIDQLAAIVREVGWRQPILVNQQGVIVAGHGRWETYQQNQDLKEPWVIDDKGNTIMGEAETTPLTEQQEKAYRLADNKLAESDVDMGLVVEELKELEELAPLTGYDMDLLIEPEEKDDEVPDVPEEPQSKLGDLYELGEHRVLCGDSTKLEDVERLMDGKKADMVFTDPPYGMDLDADYTSLAWGDRKGKKYDDVIGDRDDFKPELITTIFENFGYCKEIFTWGADYYFELIPDFKKGNYIVWDKTLESNGDAGSNSEYELLWSKQRHKRKVLNFNWFRYFGLAKQDMKKRMHPTQKPLQVCEPIIEKYAKEKDRIVDLYLGVGSTLIAAEKTGRICYGMELDPRYISVILDRWSDYTGKDPVLLETSETNDPRKGLAWSAIKSSNPSESS